MRASGSSPSVAPTCAQTSGLHSPGMLPVCAARKRRLRIGRGLSWWAVAGWLVVAALAGCSRPEGAERAAGSADSGGAVEPLGVFVSILPQVEIVQRVGGEHVRVEALVRAGQSPHTYSASPQQMARLGAARLYFSIGVDFELGALPRIREAFPELKVVDSRAGVALRSAGETAPAAPDASRGRAADEPPEAGASKAHDVAAAHGVGGSHNDAGAHEHAPGAPDPHVWLDPVRVKRIAANVADALIAADPPRAEAYGRNLAAYERALERVDQEVRARLGPHEGRTMLVYHPSYGYFAERYGLRQLAIEVNGKPPGGRSLAAVLAQAREAGVTAVFYGPQHNPQAARALASELGVEAVELDPLAPDLLANLRRMAERIAASFESDAE